MPIIKNILRRGTAKYQGLDTIDVFREETASVGADLAVSQLFQYLKTQFQFTFVVSHIETMRDFVDTLLEIKKVDGSSSVRFSR